MIFLQWCSQWDRACSKTIGPPNVISRYNSRYEPIPLPQGLMTKRSISIRVSSSSRAELLLRYSHCGRDLMAHALTLPFAEKPYVISVSSLNFSAVVTHSVFQPRCIICFVFNMDLLTSCKDKMAHFRIKELKDVLTQLGLSKQGKKQDLVDRILAILSDEQGEQQQVSGMCAKKNSVGKEEVAKLVDGIYRKMQVSGATDLASKSQIVSDSNNVKLKQESEDTYQMILPRKKDTCQMKIRCPCGSSLRTETMIQCEDTRCRTWQHASCVFIPEKPTEGAVPPFLPDNFYCELCRLSRADPFWMTMAHPLYPAKLAITSVPVD
ncbi:SUMO ligase siz1, partial [Datura stramonium]|nr:SUMO ligase siz1 [Datura stramonium]